MMTKSNCYSYGYFYKDYSVASCSLSVSGLTCTTLYLRDLLHVPLPCTVTAYLTVRVA